MEEPAAEGNKSKAVIAVVVVLVIVFAAIGFYLIYSGASGITALEGYVIAQEAVEEIYDTSNYTLSFVVSWGELKNNGYSDGWDYYIFISKSNQYVSFQIRVYSDETYEHFGPGYSNSQPYSIIHNWNIDSSEAIDIAISNNEVAFFVHGSSNLDLFQLSNFTGKPMWKIEWVDWGFMDDPHWAVIHIDATTGEVIYVDVDN